MACIDCILKFLRSMGSDKNYVEFLKLFRSKTDIGKFLNDRFLELTPKF